LHNNTSAGVTYKGSVKSLKDFWERRSESFEEDYSIRTCGITKVVTEIANLIEGKLVLDVGCGPGILAELYPKKSNIVGLDFSVSMLRSAKNRIRQLVLGDSLNLPFNGETFEVVTCFFVASDYSLKEHIFSEGFRVLEDRGVLLFADYSPEDEHWKLRRRTRPVMGQRCDIYIEDQKILSNRLELTGFHVQEAKLIRFNASFDLARYVRTKTELQSLKQAEPDLFRHIQSLTECKILKREFMLLIARKWREPYSHRHDRASARNSHGAKAHAKSRDRNLKSAHQLDSLAPCLVKRAH
jgi:SAM-dependent methyltransferase